MAATTVHAPESPARTAASSYVHGASDTPLLGDTIGAHFVGSARRHAEREALVSRHQGRRFTYGELLASVDQVARGLCALGFEPGDRVGIWSPNRWEWVAMQLDTAPAGIILVNINHAYRTSELRYALRQSQVGGLVTTPSFKGADYLTMLAESEPPPTLRTVIVLDDAARAGQIGWSDLQRAGDSVDHAVLEGRSATLDPDDAINIQYTSGTTGFPKGATLSHHNLLNNGFFVAERMRLTEADRLCIPVPFYHCFGMVL